MDSFEDYYPRPNKEANLAGARTSDRFTLVIDNLLVLASADGAEGGESRLAALLAGARLRRALAAQAGVRASWGRSFPSTPRTTCSPRSRPRGLPRGRRAELVSASPSSVYGDTDQLPMREDAKCLPCRPTA